MLDKKKKSTKTVIIVMLMTLFARFFGLLREVLIAGYYGTSIYTDAYIIANNIPTVLFDTLGQALLTSFIPMYSKICHKEDKKRADIFTIRLLAYLMLICFGLILGGEVFTKSLVHIFAAGFKGDALDITIQFTRILLPSLFAMTLLNLFTGYLQIYEKFELTTIVTVIGNISIIISLIISNVNKNVYIFVWGSLFGLFFQVLFLIPSVIKKGLFRKNQKLLKSDEYVKMLVPLLVPVFIGSALNEINSIIDRTMVSGLGTGAVSTLNYAYKIISLAISVIVTPIIAIMYPRFSSLAAQNDMLNFKDSIHKCLNYICAIIVPVFVIILGFRDYIIKILFERGNFDSAASVQTAQALICYALGLVAMAIQQVLIRVFYAKQNTFAPMFNGVICAVVNIALDYMLIKRYGFLGAAIATSIVAMIACIVLTFLLWKKRIISVRRLGTVLTKNGLSGLIMLVFLMILINIFLKNTLLNVKNILIIMFLIILAIAIYFCAQICMKNEEIVKDICVTIKRKVRL